MGVITVAARVIGFGRQLVFAHTVGSTCLGTAYTTANQVPNVIYDIVLGGALTSVVVPVLAGAAARRSLGRAPGTGDGPARTGASRTAAEADTENADNSNSGGGAQARRAADAEAGQTASALLTWAVVLLTPASLVIALVAGPLSALLLQKPPHCPASATASVAASMLAVFAPQVLLYGLAVVLYGILQAHRRFTAPVLAPVLSSVVVSAAYFIFVPLGHGDTQDLSVLPGNAQLVLSVGTTAGVAALVLTAIGPALRLRLRLRPTLRFPPGVARRAAGLAAVGVATLIAQDASVIAVIVLANKHGGSGALVQYNFGWQVFFLPYAVLAVPVATSVFPVLSATSGVEFDRHAAASTRAVLLLSWLGAALLAGAAVPTAWLFAARHSAPAQTHQLALAFAAFAPGLVGYGLTAALSRVLFACHRSRVVALSLVGGWLLVIVTDVVLVSVVQPDRVVPALGLGNTVGLSCAGLAVLVAVRRARGAAALRGTGRAAAAGLAGAVAGAAAGAGVSAGLPVSGFLLNACVALLACAVATVVYGAVVLALDGADLRSAATQVLRRGGGQAGAAAD